MPTSRRLRRLLVLFHHRWGVPVLAELHRMSGAKFVTLAHRLDVSRDSLSRTLGTLVEHAWVERNPGYGHPMRPEYVLTPAGRKLAPWCHRLVRTLKGLGLEYTALRKWTMPALLGLALGNKRFGELRAFLASTTARALTQTLKDLQAAGLVERKVTDGYPPATRYRLTRRGRRLAPVLGAL